MQTYKIPRERFAKVFHRLGWSYSVTEDNKFDVWTKPNSNVYTLVPKNEESKSYLTYQDQNIDLISLELETKNLEHSPAKVLQYSLFDHYTLFTRIDSPNSFQVPAELSDSIISNKLKSIKSILKSSKTEILKVEEIGLGHTQHGSFIIPLLLPVKYNSAMLFDANDVDALLQEYLILINSLNKIVLESIPDEKYFVDKVYSDGINSDIVRSIFGEKGIVGVNKKYGNIRSLEISAEASPLIEFSHSEAKKYRFPSVELNHSQIVPEHFIKALEDQERKLVDVNIDGAYVEAYVDSISYSGTIMFDIQKISHPDYNENSIHKAQSIGVYSDKVEVCRQAFSPFPEKRKKVIMKADLKKVKGQTGPAKMSVGDVNILEEKDKFDIFTEANFN